MTDLITLTSKWYEYVGKNVHKDKDCHFYIEADYAYGNEPTYSAFHFGYVADIVGLIEKPARKTYEEAERDLLVLVKECIASQREWVKEVLAKPDEYDEYQIAQAKKYIALFGEEE